MNIFNIRRTDKAYEVLKDLGNTANTKSIDACITWFRLEFYDKKNVDKARLKA